MKIVKSGLMDIRVKKAHGSCVSIVLKNPDEAMIFVSNTHNNGYYSLVFDENTANIMAEEILNYLSDIKGGIHDKHRHNHESKGIHRKPKGLTILPECTICEDH